MKSCLLAFLLVFSLKIFAQQTLTVNGETLILNYEVAGHLDLLVYNDGNNKRYFVQDRLGSIAELINSKDLDGSYFNEYKDVLKDFTKDSNMSTKGVGFSEYSLKKFVKAYNAEGSKKFAYTDQKVNAQARIGVFGGVTNHPLVPNPENIITPYFDVELEVSEKKDRPRQSGFLSIEHTLKNDNFQYTSTIMALGYRFRFINAPTFNIYANLQFATYTISKYTYDYEDPDTEQIITITEKNNAFRVPFIFGIGTDIRVSDSSYISIIYNEIVSAFVSNNGNFPINVSLGYKFNI